jgi:hypothetical protein
MRRNRKFDAHFDASARRDSGSRAIAEKLTEDHDALQLVSRRSVIPAVFDVFPPPLRPLWCRETAPYGIFDQPLIEEAGELFTISRKRSCKFSVFASRIELCVEEAKNYVFAPRRIRRILFRTLRHRPVALELFTIFGRSYFVRLASGRDSLDVLRRISRLSAFSCCEVQTEHFADFFRKTGLTEKWLSGAISNFDYLLLLNLYSGRSFSHASLYPIVPWVLSDYKSPTLDLSGDCFRDLGKPLGEIGEQRFREIVDRRERLDPGEVYYRWTSYCSSPLCVYLWLLRMEPFTSLHIRMQSGKFDHPARLFMSIADSWRLVTNHANDFRELTPEFFAVPDFLLNANEFNLGKLGGVPLGGVDLPAWAGKSAFDFVYMHRAALECDSVSRKLSQWIDLIWGVKQRSEENSYDPHLYEDTWDQAYARDPLERSVLEATLDQCGHVAPVLFASPHPVRQPESVKTFSPFACAIAPDRFAFAGIR